MSSENLIQFNNSLNYYYKLKGDYDSIRQKELEKIRKNTNLTIKEKHQKFEQIKKKCIICGKNGGTIFDQKNNILIAKCGNQENPCKLDIQLQKAKYENITTYMNKFNKKINNNKIDTINTKLKFLFGFTSESSTIEDFNKLKQNLIDDVKIYQKLYQSYENIIYNDSKKQEITEKNNEIFIYIQNLNELIKQFEESKDIIFLKESAELYLYKIKETADKVRNLKYIYNDIEHDDDKNIHSLIQEEYTLSQLQVPTTSNTNKVIVFNK